MWVAIYHLTGGHGWFSYLKHPYGNILAEGKLGFISPFVRLGFLGVPIFFVISGYVIVTSSENKSVAEFFSDRMARLFPSFLMSIVVVCSVFSYGFRAPYNLTFVKFFSSLSLSWYTFPEAKIQGSYWTLWPELRFYGLFLVFVLIFKKRISYKHKVFYFFVGMLAITYFTYGNNSSFGIIGLGDYGVYFILGGFIGATANLRILKATWIFILGTLCFVAINLRTWIIAWDPGHPNEWRFGEGLFLIAVITTAVFLRFLPVARGVGHADGLVPCFSRHANSLFGFDCLSSCELHLHPIHGNIGAIYSSAH